MEINDKKEVYRLDAGASVSCERTESGKVQPAPPVCQSPDNQQNAPVEVAVGFSHSEAEESVGGQQKQTALFWQKDHHICGF